MKNKIFRSAYATHFTNFIQLKRSLGYKYVEQEWRLLSFDQLLSESDQSSAELPKITIETWCLKHANESEVTRYARIVCLVQFLSYLRDCGVKVYVPLLPKYPRSTFIPYIYTHDQIKAIFTACDQLQLGCKDMRSNLFVMPCLLRMLYATGIRIGEALSLKNQDVNIADQHLTLKRTKNTKDRLVPFTNTLAIVCTDYLKHRNALRVEELDQPDVTQRPSAYRSGVFLADQR